MQYNNYKWTLEQEDRQIADAEADNVDREAVRKLRREAQEHMARVKRQVIETIKLVDKAQIVEFNKKREAGWVQWGLLKKPLRL